WLRPDSSWQPSRCRSRNAVLGGIHHGVWLSCKGGCIGRSVHGHGVRTNSARGGPAAVCRIERQQGSNLHEGHRANTAAHLPTVPVAAAAPDWYGRLPGEIATTGLTEDRYVAAVQTREVHDNKGAPGRRTSGGLYVVHHLAFRVIGPDGELSKEPWSAHQPGQNVEFFQDRGLLLRAGSKIVFDNIHLHSNGTETTARVEWGFKFHPKGYVPKFKIQNVGAGVYDLDIKGGEVNQRFEGFNTLTEHT